MFKLLLERKPKIKGLYLIIIQGIIVIPFIIELFLTIFNGYDHQNHSRWEIKTILGIIFSAILVFGFGFKYLKSYLDLFKGKIGMNLLIAIAIHTTWIYSFIISIIKWNWTKDAPNLFWEASAILVVFINLGGYIETTVRVKSKKGLQKLLEMQNSTANLVTNNKVEKIALNDLKINDIVLVRRGEMIPTDGVIIEGESYLDKSSITGESLPEKVIIGDHVLSGTINTSVVLKLSVEKLASESTLSSIVKKLRIIIENKSKPQRLAEKYIKHFVPFILFLALFALIFWSIFLTYNPIPNFYKDISIITPFRDKQPFSNALFVAVAILAIACPCAFGLAAPAAISVGSYEASNNHLIFASSSIYEQVKKVDVIVLDKTGTLTKGKPEVTQFYGLKKYRIIGSAIEKFSTHPLAVAIANYSQTDDIKLSNINEISGEGISAEHNNVLYQIGDYQKFINLGYTIDIKKLPRSAGILIAIATNKKIIGVYVLRDEIKPSAFKLLKKLKKAKIAVIMLTGDNAQNAQVVAKKLGITNVHAALKPTGKIAIIKKLQKTMRVAFVGDGLNDVMAIKQADIGIAFSSGSDITNSIADISIFKNDLMLVYVALEIGKMTLLTVHQNFIWAFGFNAVALPLAFIGLILPWVSAVLMSLSNFFLLANTILFRIRLKRKIKKIRK